jgi:Cupin-like domain
MTAPSELRAVSVVEGCKPGDISSEVLDSDEPVLLRGLVAEWPAVAACAKSLPDAAQYLSRFWTNELVTVYVSDDNDGRFFYNDEFTGFNFRAGTAHFGQLMQKLNEHPGGDGQAIYMGSTNVDRWLPGFRNENDVAVPSDAGLASIWIGNKTRISAHYDFPDNIACVVAGERRFTLFPPDQIDNLYVGPIDRTPSGQAISLVDFNKPDFNKYPRFAEALKHAFVCELQPGDAIFVPSMWWHHVESFSAYNILVNYWWTPNSSQTSSPTAALMHGILALRDLPERQRRAWKKIFDYYVFSADSSVYEHIPQAGRGCLAPLDEKTIQTLRDEMMRRLG